MRANDEQTALVEAFFEVLRTGAVDRLAEIVTDDCEDADRLPGQLPGRAGVAQKVLLFRGAHPDARIEIDTIAPVEGGARVTWTTTARGLGGAAGEATWCFTAVFEIEGRRIRANRIERADWVL